MRLPVKPAMTSSPARPGISKQLIMKVSYNWLKEYLKCDLTPDQVAEAMTSIGIEVDSVEMEEAVPGGLQGVVVAQVLTCEPHPDSDHLHITTVNDGSEEPVQVVCGAPNVAAGQKVLFARIGTVLPGVEGRLSASEPPGEGCAGGSGCPDRIRRSCACGTHHRRGRRHYR